MSRKPTKGYFVRGQFVAEGSELDLNSRPNSKAHDPPRPTSSAKAMRCRTWARAADAARDLLERLQLPDKLVDALAEAKRITNFEGKRRQMQFVGKLMRKLDEQQVAAIKPALDEQRNGAAGKQRCTGRALARPPDRKRRHWMDQFPATDTQQLRALMRQARKDDAAAKAKAAEAARAWPRRQGPRLPRAVPAGARSTGGKRRRR
jgi:ribosome-associated protein